MIYVPIVYFEGQHQVGKSTIVNALKDLGHVCHHQLKLRDVDGSNPQGMVSELHWISDTCAAIEELAKKQRTKGVTATDAVGTQWTAPIFVDRSLLSAAVYILDADGVPCDRMHHTTCALTWACHDDMTSRGLISAIIRVTAEDADVAERLKHRANDPSKHCKKLGETDKLLDEIRRARIEELFVDMDTVRNHRGKMDSTLNEIFRLINTLTGWAYSAGSKRDEK